MDEIEKKARQLSAAITGAIDCPMDNLLRMSLKAWRDELDTIISLASQPAQPADPAAAGVPPELPPLLRSAASLLRLRGPAAPDIERVAADLDAAADGTFVSAGDPSPVCLKAADLAAGAPEQRAVPDACRSHECRRVRAEMQAEIDRLRAVPAEQQFEAWYAENAFDYESNPIGSRECGLMRRAWMAAVAVRQPAEQQGAGDVLHRHLLDMLGVSTHEEAGAEIGRLHGLAARQPVESPTTNFPLTLRGLIEYGQVAGNPSQGAVPSHMCDLIAQMVPHLKRLYALYSGQLTQAVPEDVRRDADEALDLLAYLFDKWENGVPCTDQYDMSCGNAFRLDDAEFHRICDLLNRLRPRVAAQSQGEGVG